MIRFDIAISFARPERNLARELKDLLLSDGFKVFFDEDFNYELLGSDGAEYLNEVFFKESRYTLALISGQYDKSAWAQLERRAALAREHSQGTGSLIPVMVAGEKPSWLLPTRIFFNLREHSLSELYEVIRRKLLRNISEEKQIFKNPYNADIRIAASETRDFYFWQVDDRPTQLQSLKYSALTKQWNIQSLENHVNAHYLFPFDGLIIAVPRFGNKVLIHRPNGPIIKEVTIPREYGVWGMVTDCKLRNGNLLLCFASGDVWLVSCRTGEMEIIREAEQNEYVYADFLSDTEFLIAPERNEVEIRSKRKIIKRFTTSEGIHAVWCFPLHDRAVLGGWNNLLFYENSSWTLISKQEHFSNGVFETSKALSAPIFGFASFIMAGNSIEIFDAIHCDRINRVRSDGEAFIGWIALAISPDAQVFVGATRESVVLYGK
jgi:hypothetical protein